MKKVLLISVSDIISNSVIEENIDQKLLAKALAMVQETGLKPILGKELYNGLIDAVYDFKVSGSTIDSRYIDLKYVCHDRFASTDSFFKPDRWRY